MGEMNGSKTRIKKFDNIKGLAIFLIVLGHVAYLTDFKSIHFLKNLVFIFHLPIFFFVAGYFSKIDSNQPVKAFKRLIIPYLFFCILYRIYGLHYGWYTDGILFINPQYMMWFLLALFFMKMMLPIADRLKYPILTSILIALLFGFVHLEGDILALSRTAIFFPLFLSGFYYMDYKQKLEENFMKINNLIHTKLAISLIAIITMMISILIAIFIPNNAIRMYSSYGIHYYIDIVVRFTILFCGLIGTLFLNRYMTNKNCFLTKWGRNSMVIFILQPIFILPLKFLTPSYLYSFGEVFALIYTITASILITVILSPDTLSGFYTKCIDTFADLILKENQKS